MPPNTEQTEVTALIRDLTQAHAEQGFLAKSDVRDRLTALVAQARTQALREALEAASLGKIPDESIHLKECWKNDDNTRRCYCDGRDAALLAIRSLQPNKE